MSQTPGQFRSIAIETYRAQFQPDDHLLLDVREDWEWAMGHLPGAVHIPMNTIPDRHNELPSDKPVVVVCAHGMRSLQVSQYLAHIGFSDIYNLEGGTAEWVAKGLPVER
ncbi:MAG: rhodanese-like domain-containing protein [Anaerolineae bacterium]